MHSAENSRGKVQHFEMVSGEVMFWHGQNLNLTVKAQKMWQVCAVNNCVCSPYTPRGGSRVFMLTVADAAPAPEV